MISKAFVIRTLASILLAPAMAVTPLTSWAQTADDADSSHPTQWVKDSAITATIKAKLATEHLDSLATLRVETDMNGVVWLSGTAATQQDSDRAVEIARGTSGVVSVKNEIVVEAKKQ